MARPQDALRSAPYSVFGFPLSRAAWEEYDLNELELPSKQKRFYPALVFRRLAAHMNRVHMARTPAGPPVYAGQLIAADLLGTILRYMVDLYAGVEHAGVLCRGRVWCTGRLGEARVAVPEAAYRSLYPEGLVLSGAGTAEQFWAVQGGILPRDEAVDRELALLELMAANPAAQPFRALFDDAALAEQAPYRPVVAAFEEFLEGEPPYPQLNLPLMRVLRAPIEAAPDSLEGQLDFIRIHWVNLLPEELLEQLLLVKGIIREETLMRGLGPGSLDVLRFGRGAGGWLDTAFEEPEAFSEDTDWMSNVVLMAKSVYVWLHQLSKSYGYEINRLDQVPDEELDRLSRWGFTGLWLIGVWERSNASRRIKQAMGNPEALASAYSLYDYEIAHDLGGHGAYENLRERAWRRGIRLASDMVPNHMGIFSKWVVEHPDWFIQLRYPPYPGYQFNGQDLSDDPRVVVQIEDGYWDHRDAAVVFKRYDKWTGDTRYIYHGNDGTSMPWNDTAQLNFLIPEVREAVIQTILHVARMFPIIRFDAAMTLAKRHYQRLWFPQPGDAGAIPSRAEHGMTREEFERVFPKEFWREVVDRVAQEAPDTLLLAEAFWLMEGYFVRTLGMHRVYNSAFMNMLKMEENSKYRQTVKNVLEFSPEVLKRFVNFMNNPDERTAVEQFGKGDKYFGAAMLMVTMPGLPMFGHGQIEGFTEKYGMEYHRSYYDETVDQHLVYRHEVEIFPLMRKRHLFSGVRHFAFFDFVTGHGWVDENVFAFSNRSGHERAFVAYNNAYNSTAGWVNRSTAINVGPAAEPRLEFRSLADALALNTTPGHYCLFRDYRSDLEFIREGRQIAEQGLYIELGAYQYQVFLDFREVYDHDGSWGHLAGHLNGAGVPNIDEAYRELQFAEILEPFRALMTPDRLMTLVADPLDAGQAAAARKKTELELAKVLDAVARRLSILAETGPIVEGVRAELEFIQHGPIRLAQAPLDEDLRSFLVCGIPVSAEGRIQYWREMAVWALTHRIGALLWPESGDAQSGEWMDEWLLRKPVMDAYRALGMDDWSAKMASHLLKLVLRHGEVLDASALGMGERLRALFDDLAGQEYLQMNRHEDVLYLNKECFERFVHRCFVARAVAVLAVPGASAAALAGACEGAHALAALAEASGYRVQEMLRAAEVSPADDAPLA